MVSSNEIRERIRALGPWYQNIHLGDGLYTKEVEGGGSIFAGEDIPRPLWELIACDLPDLTGRRVVDIGCNAGFMSFEAKRLGAAEVTGIDVNLGATTSFIEQAEFCREQLGLDVTFKVGSFFDLDPSESYDVVLFCGVLYHLESWSRSLRRVASLCAPGGLIVLETEVGSSTEVFPGETTYKGDPTTFFVPSVPMLELLVAEHGLSCTLMRRLGSRALLHLTPLPD